MMADLGSDLNASARSGKRSVQSARDAAARLVDLHAVAVELYLVEPALTLGQSIAQGRFAGQDEGGGTQHGQDLGPALPMTATSFDG
jgi:hypothetical protein